MKYFKRILVGLLVLIALVGCDIGAGNTKKSVTFESLDTYVVGDTLEIDAQFSDNDAVALDIKSSDTNVATVQNDIVNFVGIGTVSITIENDIYNISYSKNISVVADPYEGINYIDFQANNYYEVGDSVDLPVIAYPMDLEITDVALTSSDPSIATVSGTTVSFMKAGNVEIKADVVKYGLIYTKNILVVEAIPTSLDLNIGSTYYTNSVASVELNFTPSNAYSNVTWDVHPHNVCYYNDGELQFTDAGIATIEVTSSLTGETLFSQDITVIESNKIVVNEEYRDQEIVFEGRKYELGKTAFASLQDAINNAFEGAEILVTQAEVEENITINSNKVTLYGLNKDVAGYDKRDLETTMYSKITINEGVSDITIQGFAFTSNSGIELKGDNDSITISNNYFHDTTLNPSAWVEGVSYDGGIIKFDSSSKFCDNVIIQNNYFKDIDEVALNYQQILNLKVMGNKFEDFGRDAIRSTKTIPNNNSQWVFKDNSFINGSYNGLMFRGYGTENDGLIQTISIYNNYFNNVGREDELFSNAISFRNYYEGVTNVNISYNTFKDCDNYILLRNNAESANQDNWYGYIYYNAFLGEPDSFYFKNKNTTDSVSTNPNQAILKYNFYGDIAGNSITPSASKFDGALVNSNEITDITLLENISYLYGQNIAYINSTCSMSATTDGVWTSSNTSIATVDKTGLVTCKAAGDVRISFVSNDGIKTSIDLKVEESSNIDYASLLVSIALAEEGYHEIGTNYTKYGVWYSEQVHNNAFAYGAWCAMFVSWCADQAGIPRTVIPLYASVSLGRSWFEGKGLFEYKENYTPKAGDILIFKGLDDNGNRASHTGIVVKVVGDTLYTIEGNTSDCVHQRTYDLNDCSRLTGYGTPNYPTFVGNTIDFDVSGSTSGDGLSTK